MTPDEVRAQAISPRIDWHAHRHDWVNWREFIGPQTRTIWHTLDAEQKVAIATDAFIFARDKVERDGD